MIEKVLDYSEKESWSEQNAGQVATDLGYVLNERFIGVLKDFATSTVANARMTDLLFLLAQHHFESVKPPLERMKPR